MQTTHHLILTSFFIILSELLTFYIGVKIGILAFILVLVLIFIQFTYIKDITDDYTRIFQVMTLLPLYRIITLAIPIELFTYEGYLIITTISILIGSLVLISILKLSLINVGLVLKDPRAQVLCIIAGGMVGYLEWELIRPPGFGVWVPALLILSLSAFTEELIYRGLIQQSIEKATQKPIFAILLTSTLHTTFFISYYSAPELLLIFLTSGFFGYIVSRSGSIVGVSISHALVNIGCFVIFPYLGMSVF